VALASVEVEVAPTKLVPSIVPSLPSLNPPQEIPSLEICQPPISPVVALILPVIFNSPLDQQIPPEIP